MGVIACTCPGGPLEGAAHHAAHCPIAQRRELYDLTRGAVQGAATAYVPYVPSGEIGVLTIPTDARQVALELLLRWRMGMPTAAEVERETDEYLERLGATRDDLHRVGRPTL